MKLLRTVLLIIAVIAAWLVLPAGAQEPPRIEPLTITNGDTATLFSAEVADTEELRERGLMFRHRLPEDQVMLFDFGQPRPVSMWMKDTYIPLDMIFVRPDGTIAAIVENAVPKSLETIGVQEPIRGVIELAAGTVKRLGITQNDKVYNRIFETAEN